MSKRAMLTLLLGLSLVAAACGGDESAGTSTKAEDTSQATTAVAAETTTTVSAARGVENLRAATIRIVGEGTFVDPLEGERANVAGSGSGFIIDERGIAVTNNHVVTGAAFLNVYLDGRDEPVNARVLGVSECNDLAVIDLEGDGYPYLEWFEGDIVTGLEIYAAGFPLGTEEYTLLEGIVSKEEFTGETSWASIDSVIEHSADTLPGNSGGPVVTRDGRLVAVNFAGNSEAQAFAIGREIARPAIEMLAGGQNLETIGINGEALVSDESSGIWVFSVESGSPADRIGVRAGDIITRMEDLMLATDGTMDDYCEILRSHGPGGVLSIDVYRPGDDMVFEGRLNDPNGALSEVFSFASEVDDVVTEDPPPTDGSTYTEYMAVTEESGSIVVSVPIEWSDTLVVPWEFNEALIGPALGAAPDYEAWKNGWATPGVFIAASREIDLSVSELLDITDFSGACAFADRVDYDDGIYTGLMDVYESCGSEGSTFLIVAARPPEADFLVLVQLVIVSEADWDAADEIIQSFVVEDPQAP